MYADTTTGGNVLEGLASVNNTIVGAPGDTIYTNGLADTVVGALNDTVQANGLSDTVTAGRNDNLYAGAGVDTFLFSVGDGAVTLNESTPKMAGVNQDILQLGTGITEAGTQITRTLSNALVLSFGNGDQVSIPNYFTLATAQPSIVFADGTIWNYTSITSQLVFTDTTSGGNFLEGLSGVNNRIVGAPNDIIFAGNLDDDITAGKNDTLYAGAGVDTFLFNEGDGAVTLNESFLKTAGTDQDVLQLGTGITEANTQITRNTSNGLVLSFGNGDQVTIPYYFSYAVCRPTIAFSDGTQWNFASVAGALGYNTPTVTQTLANQSASAGTPFSFTLPGTLFSETGANDSLTLSATLANGSPLPGWLVFNPSTGTFSGTPSDQSTGPLVVNVTASDQVGLTASTTLNLQVNPTYEAPTVGQALGTQTIAAGNPWSYTLPASLFSETVAGDTLTYQATLANGNPLPSWLTFNAETQTFSGMPTDQTTGALVLTVSATDMGGLTTNTTLNVQVNPSYQAPTINQTLVTQTIAASNPWSYTLPASLFSETVAGDTLTYQATLANGNPLPSWLTFNAETQTFSGTPTDQTTGALVFTITATDMGGLATSTTLNVQINPSYEAPTVSQSLTNQALSVGTTWSYGLPSTLFAEPVEGDTLTYTATLANGNPLPSWLTFDPANRTFSGTPTDQTTGAFAVEITATDLGGLATSTTLNLQVNPTYQAPAVTQTLPVQSVTTGAAWSYSLPASLFSETIAGDTLSYGATLANGAPLPTWLSFDATNLVFSGTPPSGTTGTIALKVTATDLGGLSASTALNIIPSAPANAPAVTQSLSSPTIAAGTHWSYALPAGLFSESVAGDSLSYIATISNGNPLPTWLTFNPATLTFSGTPTDQTTGAFQLEITATDQEGLSASALLNLTVNPVYEAPTPPQPLYYAIPNESLPLFQMTTLGQPWQYTLPSALFTEPIAGDTLTYSATMADGGALPSWLTFDPVHQTFSGTPPGQVSSALSLEITATDMGGLSSSVMLTVQLQQNVLNLAAQQSLAAPNGQTAIQEDNAYSTVTADNENHMLVVAGASDSAILGDGNNWVADTGSYDTVTLGNGNNVLMQTGVNDSVTLGNGNNSITVENGGNIAAGNGNNVINGSGAYEFITLGSGANNVTLSNDRDNVTAGDGDNIISGSGGSETITVGGGSNEITVSGSGANVYAGNGNNVITAQGYGENVTLGNGTDTVTGSDTLTATVGHGTYTLENCGGLRFGADTPSGDLWFQQVGQDLQITEVGVGGTVTLKNWYEGAAEQTYNIYAGDGTSISASGVNQLVQAMAAFAPPAPGATSFTPAEQQALAPVLAANWH
ncbi:putative Ig domain-containing protein [Trinickia acidisoli]|uniref:putative Ig domain-containing protein n=1 Tax=Trinickia acidisoli TaxID=2767482 RepID=UPI001A8FCEFA|nr:putative Ig domain-containing protein [Trinickia acidisoli]